MTQTAVAFCTLLIAAGLPLAGSAQPARAAAVRALSHQKFEWMRQRDTAALAALLHPALRYIHSNGWNETRTDVLHHLADSTLVYHSVAIAWDTAVVFGRHTATVTGRGQFDVSLRGTRGQFSLLYTEVYARTGRRWTLVQRHACRLP